MSAARGPRPHRVPPGGGSSTPTGDLVFESYDDGASTVLGQESWLGGSRTEVNGRGVITVPATAGAYHFDRSPDRAGYGNSAPLRVASGVTWKWSTSGILIPTASVAGDVFIVAAGFIEEAAWAGIPTGAAKGVMLAYDATGAWPGGASANWKAFTRDGASANYEVTDTGVPAVVGADRALAVQVNDDGTEAEFTVGGAVVQHATHIVPNTVPLYAGVYLYRVSTTAGNRTVELVDQLYRTVP